MPRLVLPDSPAIVRAARHLGLPRKGDPPASRLSCMYAVFNLLNTIITIYIWLLIASVVLSWLIAFNVVSTGNHVVYQLRDFLYRITEPLLRPIRNLLPSLGGIDISPVVLILALYFLRDLAFELLRP